MYKPKERVNVAEGAYAVILSGQAEGSAVKGAELHYLGNNGRVEFRVLKVSRFQGFKVSRSIEGESIEDAEFEIEMPFQVIRAAR